jgi:hypothetical protein
MGGLDRAGGLGRKRVACWAGEEVIKEERERVRGQRVEGKDGGM